MITKLKFKQGQLVDLPILDTGEPGFTVDSGELYIGKDGVNVKFYNKSEVDNAIDSALANLEFEIEDFNFQTLTLTDIENKDETPKLATGRLISEIILDGGIF